MYPLFTMLLLLSAYSFYTGLREKKILPWLLHAFFLVLAMYTHYIAILAALAWLASGTHRITYGCAGHVPEIMDGDYPHLQRGCDAQAWGVSELLRVWVGITGQPIS